MRQVCIVISQCHLILTLQTRLIGSTHCRLIPAMDDKPVNLWQCSMSESAVPHTCMNAFPKKLINNLDRANLRAITKAGTLTNSFSTQPDKCEVDQLEFIWLCSVNFVQKIAVYLRLIACTEKRFHFESLDVILMR